jgi:PPK2 family polyphosphate:nucleotide phosphotransferase
MLNGILIFASCITIFSDRVQLMNTKKIESCAIKVVEKNGINLQKINTSEKSLDLGKERSRELLISMQEEIGVLQEKLYAEHSRSLLIVFQAMDTGGKDGAIRNLFTGINPAGVQITSFKAPTSEDLRFDYLKRIHQAVPPKGWIGVWNRSHYEDVLIVKVHKIIDKKTCVERYEDINSFERMLSRNGTTILKFFLHISKDEQKKRLQERLDTSEKHWKFDPADLAERKYWNDYMKAYEHVFNATSTEWAPWYIIPSDQKSARNLMISSIVLETLKGIDPQFPEPKFQKGKISIT